MNKDTSLGEKIRTLFRKQGITIASILMAIGMAIGVLIEALLPGSAVTGYNNPDYTDVQHEEIRNKIKELNDNSKVRQEYINLLKGYLLNQVTSIKETIAKVLNKDTSLGEKIRMLFREQGIMIASILMAIGMAIGVLVEALLPGGTAKGGIPPLPKDMGMKEWLRNKLKALASLLKRLGIKSAEALPGIIGAIISWVLNRAAEVVGWVSQNLWALIVGVEGLIYKYMVTRK